jgi:hypothetical protein
VSQGGADTESASVLILILTFWTVRNKLLLSISYYQGYGILLFHAEQRYLPLLKRNTCKQEIEKYTYELTFVKIRNKILKDALRPLNISNDF